MQPCPSAALVGGYLVAPPHRPADTPSAGSAVPSPPRAGTAGTGVRGAAMRVHPGPGREPGTLDPARLLHKHWPAKWYASIVRIVQCTTGNYRVLVYR